MSRHIVETNLLCSEPTRTYSANSLQLPSHYQKHSIRKAQVQGNKDNLIATVHLKTPCANVTLSTQVLKRGRSMRNVLRILCSLAVFITSSAYSVALFNAAHHHPITPGVVIAALVFAGIGVLSFAAIYFILGASRG